MSLRDTLGLNRPKQSQKKVSIPPPPKTNRESKNHPRLMYGCGHDGRHPIRCPTCEAQIRIETQQKKISQKHKIIKQKLLKQSQQIQRHGNRLPDNSTFLVVYNAEHKHWTGSLTVKYLEQTQIFNGSESGVFALLREFDHQYHNWLDTLETQFPCTGK